MKYFGTDGIRGVVDKDIDSVLAYKIGIALGKSIIKNNYVKKVLIGIDTRLSNDVISYSLACGLMDKGIDCYMLGIVPTACVSYLTSVLGVGYGVMITASHNSWEMNGIKVINRFGYKCDIDEEKEIENYISKSSNEKTYLKGKIINAFFLVEKYIKHLKDIIDIDLTGLNIALDLANGSNYNIAPNIFKNLGANVICVANKNDGRNINQNCGAQFIENLQKEVVYHNCDFGFAFDGDADRLRVVLNNGKILDGDDLLYIFANYLNESGKLNSQTVVGTIMSNSGLEMALKNSGINLIRVDVGDKNVIDMMIQEHYSLGGEPSGHIAIIEYNTTCDALFNALYLLKIILKDKIDVQKYLSSLIKLPLLITSINVSDKFRKNYNCDNTFVAELETKIDEYRENAKVIVRPSGTESVFRISVESMSDDRNKFIRNNIVNIIADMDKNLIK